MKRYLSIACLSLLPLGAFAQTAQEDKSYLTQLLQDSLSGAGRTVDIQGFAGALSSEATIEHLSIADETGIWLSADNLVLDWDRAALLSGALNINRLSAARIELSRLPPSDPNAPESSANFALPDLPVSIDIGAITADRIILGQPVLGERIEIHFSGNAQIIDGKGAAQLNARRIDGKHGQFAINASMDETTGIAKLSLLAEEQENGIAARKIGLPENPALRLSIVGEGPRDNFQSQISLTANETARVAGTVGFVQSPDGTRALDLNLGGDVSSFLPPQHRSFFGSDVALKGRVAQTQAGEISLSQLDLITAQAELSGTAKLRKDFWPLAANVTGQINGHGTPVALPLPGNLVTISNAEIDLSFDSTKADRWDLAAQVNEFAHKKVSAEKLGLIASGTLSDLASTNPERLTAKFLISSEGAIAHSIELRDVLSGDALVSGKATLFDDGAISLTDFLLDSVALRAKGAISLGNDYWPRSFTLTGNLARNDGNPIRLPFVEQTVMLGGASFGAAFDASQADKWTLAARANDITHAAGKAAAITVNAHGNLITEGSEENGVSAKVIVDTAGLEPSDAAIAKALGNSVKSTAVLAYRAGRLQLITADIQGQDYTAKGTARVNFDTQKAATQATLDARDFTRFSMLAQRPIRGAGKLDITADTTLDGSIFTATAAGRLQSPKIGIAEVDKLIAGDTAIEFAAHRDGAEPVLDILSLKNSSITFTTSGSEPSGFSIEASLADIGLIAPDFSGPIKANGTLGLSTAGYDVSAAATGPAGMAVSVNGTLNKAFQPDLAITGMIPLAFANGIIKPRRIEGQANIDLNLSGGYALSNFDGTISTAGARFAAPNLDVTLGDMAGSVTLANGKANIGFEGREQKGGTINISGPIDLAAPFNGDLQFSVNDLVYLKSGQISTTMRGNGTIKGPLAGGAAIVADIDLKKTEIIIRNYSDGPGAEVLPIKHRGASAAATQTQSKSGLNIPTKQTSAIAYPLNITISSLNKIFVRGHGLDAELGGEIQIGGTTANPIPTGEFELVRGRLDVLGQRFDLEEGSATMIGAFEPFISFSLDTVVGDYDIMLLLDGKATDPTITVSSLPELPEDEALSKLIFGRDVQNLSPFQIVKLIAAIRTIKRGEGLPFVSNTRRKLRLDDLDVHTDDVGNVSVRAGKYTSEKTYTDLSVGADGTTALSIQLNSNKNLSTRATISSDGNNGIGFYFQKDY